MNILITGNTGYVGSVLTSHLRNYFPHATLVGYDLGYFSHCLTSSKRIPESYLDHQIFGDVRNIKESILHGFDSIVHLAAISNDPMGNKFEAVTDSINYQATKELLNKAIRLKITSFVFASSCSIYGEAEGKPKTENDSLNPLTAYARSKVAVENAMSLYGDEKTILTALRFSTACGMSPRLRLDLVLNDFVASSISCGGINVMSDGSPWRPLIDVKDMARAIEWAIQRKENDGGKYLHVNVGSDDRNVQVKELAQLVSSKIAGTDVNINKHAQPDKRSYKVDFSLFKKLAPDHQPNCSLEQSIEEVYSGLSSISFKNKDFRNSSLIRLQVLQNLIASKELDNDLNWI